MILIKKGLSPFLNDQEVFHMSNYIERDMILKNINAKTKEEAITFMIRKTLNDANISKEIIESDYIGNYELENMTAILSCYDSRYSTKVIVGILSKPILWNKKKIQLIIIPLIGEKINSKILIYIKNYLTWLKVQYILKE